MSLKKRKRTLVWWWFVLSHLPKLEPMEGAFYPESRSSKIININNILKCHLHQINIRYPWVTKQYRHQKGKKTTKKQQHPETSTLSINILESLTCDSLKKNKETQKKQNYRLEKQNRALHSQHHLSTTSILNNIIILISEQERSGESVRPSLIACSIQVSGNARLWVLRRFSGWYIDLCVHGLGVERICYTEGNWSWHVHFFPFFFFADKLTYSPAGGHGQRQLANEVFWKSRHWHGVDSAKR